MRRISKIIFLLVVFAFVAAAQDAPVVRNGENDQQETSADDIAASNAIALFEKIEEGDIAAVESLLLQGVNPNAIREGKSALAQAARRGRTEIVALLLAHGADPNIEDSNALFDAAFRGHVEIVRLLLEKGANASANGYEDHTVLITTMHGAIAYASPAALRRISLGEDYRPDFFDGVPPDAHLRITRMLIEHGANLNVVADCGETALIGAAMSANVELVRELLARGANVNYSWPILPILRDYATGSARDDEDEELSAEERRAAEEWAQSTAAARAEIIELLRRAGAREEPTEDETEHEDGLSDNSF